MHAVHFWGKERGLPVSESALPMTEKEQKGKKASALGLIKVCVFIFIQHLIDALCNTFCVCQLKPEALATA